MLAVITFVRTALKHWRAGVLGLLLLALAVQTVRVGMANNRADRIQVNLNEARAELKALSDAKDKQKAATGKAIEQVRRQQQISDKVAREIETAPLSGDCRTPDEIMRAEI